MVEEIIQSKNLNINHHQHHHHHNQQQHRHNNKNNANDIENHNNNNCDTNMMMINDCKLIATTTTKKSSSCCLKMNFKRTKRTYQIDNYIEWEFNVILKNDDDDEIILMPSEIIAVTGNCMELGNWNPELCVFLEKKNDSLLTSSSTSSSSSSVSESLPMNRWRSRVHLPKNQLIEYRYFICVLNSTTNSIIIRKWETHTKPRIIKFDNNGCIVQKFPLESATALSSTQVSYDIFGEVNEIKNLNRGWLTEHNEIIQLKFYNKPFLWMDNNGCDDDKYKNLHIKLTPMWMDQSLSVFKPITEMDSSQCLIEYVKFDLDDSELKKQSEPYGCEWNSTEDIIIFHINVSEMKKIAYLIELYGKCYSETNENFDNNNSNRCLKHLGYGYLLPDMLKRSDDDLKMPIKNSNSTQNHNLCILNISYLIIKPMMPKHNFKLRSTCINYWKQEWTGLNIGHRGSGVSFRVPSTDNCNDSVPIFPPENTIASIKNAIINGADMIELDVHLTKDGIPIVYHDFHVNISQLQQNSLPRYGSDLIPVLIKDLKYDELKNLKTYHLLDGMIRETPTYEHLSNSNEYKLFPKLQDVFIQIQNKNIGFDIEIKWPQKLIDGTWESQQTIDKNYFCDCILDCIIKYGYGRCLIMSCFDADICTMLRFKQNIYPILFLTLGPTKRYPLYLDPRCNSIKWAICLSKSMEFLGIIPHTEDILNDPEQINLIKSNKQIMFCWGDDTNSLKILNKLKLMGLNGIIYDRIDKILNEQQQQNDNNRGDDENKCSSFRRKSIFLINNENENENDDYNEFFKLQYLEENEENDGECNEDDTMTIITAS